MNKIKWNNLNSSFFHLAFVPGNRLCRQPHCHDFSEIFLVTAEKVVHYINEERHVLKKGTAVLMRPDDRHGFSATSSEDIKEQHIINLAFPVIVLKEIEKRLFEGKNFWDGGQMPRQFILSERQAGLLAQQFQELANLPQQKAYLERFLLNFIYICNPEQNVKTENMPDWLRQAYTAMSKPDNMRKGIKRFYELCGRCHEHCVRELKKHTGQTVTEYVNSLRLEHAARMLRTTTESIDEIVSKSGFENLSYFHVLFRKEYKTTPRKFRMSFVAQVLQPHSLGK